MQVYLVKVREGQNNFKNQEKWTKSIAVILLTELS